MERKIDCEKIGTFVEEFYEWFVLNPFPVWRYPIHPIRQRCRRQCHSH